MSLMLDAQFAFDGQDDHSGFIVMQQWILAAWAVRSRATNY